MNNYFGEANCIASKKTGESCNNKAYYIDNSKIVCGVHSKKTTRKKLPINPNKDANRKTKFANERAEVMAVAEANRKACIKGRVICQKMFMMKDVKYCAGFLNIFPNYKHLNREDGLGLPSLSPKSIGPIFHGQPNLPVAKNLENFHQGNKVFPDEVDGNGEPTDKFYQTQIQMYNDIVPHRHKDNAVAGAVVGKNKNVPLYSIWVLPDGTRTKISYFESRQFYCNYYERSVANNSDYKMLLSKIANGYNLQICGYDAYPVDIGKSIDKYYKDISRPFGHELVLYTMLVHSTGDYPWKKYKTFEF